MRKNSQIMSAVNIPAFSEIERRISGHNLRISIDLSQAKNKNTIQDHELEAMDENTRNCDVHEVKRKNEEASPGCFETSRSSIGDFFSRNSQHFKRTGILLLNLFVLVYFAYATLYWHMNATNCEYEWCDGYGMLLILFVVAYAGLLYYQIIKKYFGECISSACAPVFSGLGRLRDRKYGACLCMTFFYVTVAIAIVAFLVYDTIDSRDRLISFLGVIVVFLFGWIFSKNPSKIKWRPVICGFIMQFGFGLITIRWAVGRAVFHCLANKVATFLDFAKDGAAFVFSRQFVDNGIFAFSVLPVIFFFSFMIQILYYWGVMQWVIMKFGWCLHKALGTTVCESLTSAANTVLGMTESPLLIKPYLSTLTKSEMHAIMCSGFATVSGTVLAAYISFGAQPAHLVTASFMSAPAALCFSKLFYPETEKSRTTFENIPLQKSEDTSVMDAATKGAMAAIPLVLGVIANIVAFVAMISFLNAILSWLGSLVGFSGLTFEWILSKAFMPVSWLIGVPWDQCEHVATLIGLKTAVNEFVAYQKLGEMKLAGKLTARSEAIATYAICGFANPGSIGIMMGGLGSLAPDRRCDIAEVVVRAFVAGSVVCLLTASVAGMLMDESSFATSPTNSTVTESYLMIS